MAWWGGVEARGQVGDGWRGGWWRVGKVDGKSRWMERVCGW